MTTVNERNGRVAAALRQAGIEPEIRILDADVKTAAAAAEQLGCAVAAIANSLVFECDGEPLLVMSSGGNRVDTARLATILGANAITKATPQRVLEATGQVIGGVAPTGHPGRLRTVVDQTLAHHPVIWAAAGTANSVMPLTYAQLLVVTDGLEAVVR
ncbi:YbaK/EbsC family protein [Mycolicibacterium mucogenicum]|uniref:YbaK/EbsC family protein n=1 Tax=Mycolicibacterium TaxID=1866885 RepID=UPI00226A9497|nr:MULTISPECIES: YbaK/EbsC family protein [Mycolicibacterium]MCX8560887.1 YbaK/EbsC family protein [Mycolicibacterium mucogenicum]